MKSILLHIYDDTGLESRLQAGFDLARAFGGHLTCLHATPFEDYLAADPVIVSALPEEFSRKMERKRIELQERIEARLAAEGVQWDWIHLDELMSTALLRYSILSDIVLVSIAGRAMMKDDPRPLAAAVATGAQSPVLAVPPLLKRLRTDAPIVVAWNGSPEAAAALRASLPVLQIAPEVHILEIEEKPARYPRDRAARYLSRHGIEAEIIVQRPGAGGVSETIERESLRLGAGMIVMGAYGHSRLREFLLGGVTSDLIVNSTLPLFLAH